MADVTSAQIYEVLQAVQAAALGIDRKIDGVKAEMLAISGHLGAMRIDIHNIYIALDRHETRLHRIERRLELGSPALP